MLRLSCLALFFATAAHAQPLEVAFARGGGNVTAATEVCVYEGGAPACRSLPDMTSSSFDIAAADLDGDGDTDYVLANGNEKGPGPSDVLCLREASGDFACEEISPQSGVESDGVAIADMDGDGDLDLLFARVGASRLCLNDGNAGFTCSAFPVAGDHLEPADLDGDGDLDLAVSPESGPDLVCENDGGTFACEPVSPESTSSREVVVADLNGDGDLDLAFALRSQANRVCLREAQGYACAPITATPSPTFGIAATDLDGDGDLDLVTAERDQSNEVCLNDGTATFSCSPVSTDANDTFDVAVGDVDGDGDADLAFANLGQTDRLCLNTGGSFTCEDIGDPFSQSAGVVIGASRVATAAETGPGPAGLALRLGPNPVDASGALWIGLAVPAPIRATVHDALGREILVLHDGPLAAGETEVAFPRLAPGLYVVHVITPTASASAAVTVAR